MMDLTLLLGLAFVFIGLRDLEESDRSDWNAWSSAVLCCLFGVSIEAFALWRLI